MGIEIINEDSPDHKLEGEILNLYFRIIKIIPNLPYHPKSYRKQLDIYTAYVTPGFEDIIGGQLGAGLFENTGGIPQQLSSALVLSRHKLIEEVFEDPTMSPEKIIAECRAQQVLKGLKIMDLGCGSVPYFAKAARSLGANVWTVDCEDLCRNDRSKQHIVINMNEGNAVRKLAERSKGEFDLVTESIIDKVSYNPTDLERPNVERLIEIGDALLKPGGHTYYRTHPSSSKNPLRKKI